MLSLMLAVSLISSMLAGSGNKEAADTKEAATQAATEAPQIKPMHHKSASNILHECRLAAAKICSIPEIISSSTPCVRNNPIVSESGKCPSRKKNIMSPSCRLLEYYTPKTSEFQVILGEITIFVNYADFLCQHHYEN